MVHGPSLAQLVDNSTRSNYNTAMLPITIVAIEFKNYELSSRALDTTLRLLPKVKEVLVISDKDFYPGSRYIYHSEVKDFTEYNKIMLKGVAQYVTEGHALYVQYDSMVHQSNAWQDIFLEYDYIGAPWPNEPEGMNIGNGGFSLRSARLLQACQDDIITLLPKYNYINEDRVIGNDFRLYLENKHQIKFAPTAIAQKFSYELGQYHGSLGIHGVWNILGFGRRETAEFYCSRLEWNNWNEHKWNHIINALWQRQHLDLLETAIKQLKKNQPHLNTQVGVMIYNHKPYLRDGEKLLELFETIN
jgi:hypothetical protein